MSRIYLIFDEDDNALPEDRFRFLQSIRKLWERSKITRVECLKVLIASRDHRKANEIFHGLPYLDNEKEQQGKSSLSQNCAFLLSTSCPLTGRKPDCLNSLRLGAANDRSRRIEYGEETIGKWILCNQQYCGWRGEPGPAFLWLQGNPGTGKSTLMKQIHRRLGEEGEVSKAVVASFYYNARGGEVETSHTRMLRTLLYQILLQETEKTYPHFRSIYRIKRRQMQPWHFGELQSIFESISGSQSESRTFYLLLNALDESNKNGIRGVIHLFKRMTDSNANIKVLLASRPGLTISEELANSRYHLVLEEENSKDIERTIITNLGFLRNSARAKSEWVICYIVSRARGVFLWVSLLNNDIKRLEIEGWSTTDIRVRVEELPDSLVPYYQRITSHLAGQKVAYQYEGKFFLHWIVYSERPMTIGELRDAIAINSKTSTSIPFVFSTQTSMTIGLRCSSTFLKD